MERDLTEVESILDMPNAEMFDFTPMPILKSAPIINNGFQQSKDAATQTDFKSEPNLANDDGQLKNGTIAHIQTPFCTMCDAPEATWNCALCTFNNESQVRICGMCNTSADDNKNDIIRNRMYELVSCQSCDKTFDGKTGMVINICLHRFCLDCIKETINKCEKLDARCPYVNKNNQCDCIISKDQIALFNCDILTKAYEAKEIFLRDRYTMLRLCLNPNCEGFELCDVSVNCFICKECAKPNCLICQAIHEGKSCAEYQDYINRKSFICPNCTLENNLTVYECEMCHEKNPDFKPDDTYYCEMLILSEQSVVCNDKEFDCPICFVPHEPGEGIMLKACLHNVCRPCLQECIKHSDTPVVKCPYIDQNFSCMELIADNEIREIVDEETLNEHLGKSIKLAEATAQNSFHCKTPDCDYWCEYEDGVNNLFCPTCEKLNCLNCRVIHDPMSCKEYQDDIQNKIGVESSEKLLNELIAKGEAMKCPGCNITLSKRTGCDYITCSMCQIGICWVTKGPRWGPKGAGDTSGGCKCNFLTRKCHPNCGNCH